MSGGGAAFKSCLSLGESLIHMQLFPSDRDFFLVHVVSETQIEGWQGFAPRFQLSLAPRFWPLFWLADLRTWGRLSGFCCHHIH